MADQNARRGRHPGRRVLRAGAILGLLLPWVGLLSAGPFSPSPTPCQSPTANCDFFEWEASPGATYYNVYRGDLDTFRADGRVFTASMICLANGVDQDADGDGLPDFKDGEDPPAGAGFGYLITAGNGQGESTLDTDSSGPPRINDLPCEVAGP